MADGITDEMIARGAAEIADLLTMLDVDPDERLEHDGPSTAAALAESVLQAGLAGRAVVDFPEPTAWRNRMDGDVDIWPVGGWSVTASPSGVEICTSRDGLGGGFTFRKERAREFGVAILAADAHLAARQSTTTRSDDATALPGDTSQRGPQAGDDRGVPRDTNGITDEMVEAGMRAMVDLGCVGCDPDCSCRELDEKDEADFRLAVRTALAAALAGRTVVDNPDTVDLRQFDAAQLNALAAELEKPHGFLPLSIRYGAAAAALRYIEAHWPAEESADVTAGGVL